MENITLRRAVLKNKISITLKQGRVTLKQNSFKKPVKLNQPLKGTLDIITGANGSCIISLKKNYNLTVSPDTAIKISSAVTADQQ
ncbi:MAG TPA: hypothetical protein VKS21_00085, partial [Spirochaetota bacterium]|nr:hypothetical protein [Spirochaetota bacterium]